MPHSRRFGYRSIPTSIAVAIGAAGIFAALYNPMLALLFGEHSSFAHLPEFRAFVVVCAITPSWFVFLAHRMAEIPDVENAGARPRWLSPLVAFVALSTGIVVTAALTYRMERESVAHAALAQLETVARLKVQMIESWVSETADDVTVAVENPEFAGHLDVWLRAGHPHGSAERVLLDDLSRIAKASHYLEISLRDPASGALLLTNNGDGDDTSVRSQAIAVARSGSFALEDFHSEPERLGAHYVGLFVAVMDAAHSSTRSVMHIAIDPARVLLPMIERWPGAAMSAEAILARVDADRLTILNDLADRPDTGSLQQIPLDQPRFFAAGVSSNRWGATSGIDDRSVPVLAYVMPVARTPWFLAAKVDQSEAYAELNTIAFMSAAVIGILMLFGAWWWVENHRTVAMRLHHHFEHRLMANRIEFLARFANDCIVQCDVDGRITEFNDRCLTTYGYQASEMQSMNIASLRAPGTRGDMPATMQALRERGNLIFETEHCRKSGSTFPVEISARVVDVDGSQSMHAVIRDISERKSAQARILGLARLYATISAANQAIVRAHSLDDAFRLVCQACVEHGRFRLAWVGLADARRIVPRESYGAGAGYLTEVNFLIGPACEGEPSALALMRDQAYSCNDFSACAASGAWCDAAESHGLRAAIALPLHHNGRPIGTLTVYSADKEFLDEDSVALLDEMAGNLSFAVAHFANERERREAEAALRQSELRLQQAQAIAMIGDWEFDRRSRLVTVSREAARMLGQTDSGVLSLHDALSGYPPAALRKIRHAYRTTARTNTRVEIELQHRNRDGTSTDQAIVVIPAPAASGRPIKMYGTMQDITIRNRLEAERTQHAQRVAELSRRVVSVQEQERRLLSAELHDRTGANLAAINLNLIALGKNIPAKPDGEDLMRETRDLLTDTIISIREFCSDLRPAVLDYAGLLPALQNLAQQFGRRTGTRVRIAHQRFHGQSAGDVESILFRIAQEALTNCTKHAHANTVDIELSDDGGRVCLVIRDDGAGFDPATLATRNGDFGHGLLNMRERAEFAGGEFQIESSPGKGTTIRVTIPELVPVAPQAVELGKNGSSLR